MAYIEFKDINKSFDGQEILKGIHISIERGEFITLLGPSGCGKTTLLRCLAGLEKVDNGAVYLDGLDITNVQPKDRNISMIFQQYSLFPTMTVYKNIAFGLKMQKVSKEEIDRRVKEALELVDLSGSEKKYPSQLSGGEQQRVALARSIVTKSKVLLLDEPFSAIDAKLRKALQIQIKEIHTKLGITTIFVTHDQEEAMRMSDRIYLMNQGDVEQVGSPMDLYLRPKTPFVSGFMGHYNMFTAEVFARMTQECLENAGIYAVRPEAIHISSTAWEKQLDDSYYLEGTIKRIIPQGNIMRYTIQVENELIDVDVLFDAECSFAMDEKVYLEIEKQQIMIYNE